MDKKGKRDMLYKLSSQKKLTAMLDTMNTQYKTLKTHHTPAMAPGQCKAPSIHRQYVCSTKHTLGISRNGP